MTKTAQEFIQSSFSPIIATLCSPKVENIVSKNNLTLPELLQPFTLLDWEGQIREPGGSLCSIKNLNLVVRDVNWKPVQPTEARRQLNNAVLHNYDEKVIGMKIDLHKFDIPQATPWFDAWRETYLEVQFPSDHEFTKHFLACIIVATSLEDDIVETFNTLNEQYSQLQNVTPPKLPKWFNNSVLKSYLLLHDNSAGPRDRADKMFETMKQSFGAANCFLLSINSKTSADPKLLTDFWFSYLKQASDFSSESISLSSSSSTQVESQVAVQHGNISNPDERQNTLSTSTNVEGVHPLTTTENDIYDNANSLQPYSFSGSSESVNVSGKPLERQSEIHGAALNANDIEAIKSFLHDYTSKAFVPHLEKQISQLSEVVANKKGVSRSLLSATKRWFTTGKSGSTTVNNTVIYSSECPELQLRRLGDLWLMCGQWARAFDAYHTAKREFYADSAWLCYAGALEMAAVSAFLAGDATRKTFGYMEESIVTYLNTCRMVQYAVRATLLSVPCLISAGMHGEAAKQLIRMTSEDSDLRSAMLLEQAALCFLKGPANKIMTRKYAFHMVLAGHRFSKAGQKKHAYRCYKQAYQVYSGSGWRLSTDHVQFALGRLAGSLRAREAASWLAAPLAPHSPQPPALQDAFLREFMAAHQQFVEILDEYKEHLPVLPVPLLSIEETAVLCVGPVPLSSPGRTSASSLSLLPQPNSTKDDPYWHKLEETVIQVAQGSLPMIFKPTIDLYTQKTDSHPIVPQGEPIQIAITLYNPLKIPILLKELELLWQFTLNPEETDTSVDEVLNNEPLIASGLFQESNVIHGQKIKSFLLEGENKKSLNLNITPLKTGQLSIQGLAFNLINVGEGKNNENGVTVVGKLNLQNGANCSDKLLQITVIPHAPCLQMTLSETSNDVISGEILSVDVEFRNVGPVALNNLHLAVSHPECMSVVTQDHATDDFKVLYDQKYRPPPDYSDERASRAARAAGRAAAAARRLAPVAPRCSPGAHVRATLLLRPHRHAPDLYLLAYYETARRARPHRLLRHVFRFKPTEAVEISATPRRGLSADDGKVIENMHLSIEVKNICNERDDNITLEVLEASLLSRQWMLTHTRTSEEADSRLIPRERVHFVLKSKRIFEELPEGSLKYSCLKFANRHPETEVDVNEPPYSKFISDCMSPLLENVEASNNSVPAAGLIQSMLVLRWKAINRITNHTAVGQHCLWMDCFTKTLSGEREKVPINNMIQLDEFDSSTDISLAKDKSDKNETVIIKVEHSTYVDHNFKVNKLCMVPVVFNIVNCHGSPVTVFIDMHKQNRESSGEIGWAGALSNGLNNDSKELGLNVTLEKFETRRVQVRALVASPGSFMVGGSFHVTTRRGRAVASHAPDTTSLLVVKQTSI